MNSVPTSEPAVFLVRFLLSVVLCVGGSLFGEVFAQDDPAVIESSDPIAWVTQPARLESLASLYLYLHKHPELSFQEQKTAARIAKELTAIGATVTTDIGGFGVVGMLDNGPGPTVMVRTDLDALPIIEATCRPYASTVKVTDDRGKKVGVMHACGHDVHMTVMVGTARYMAAHRDRWSGKLMLVGQPAEEKGGGAKAMLEDGLFTRFPKPDYALALHCHASLACGKVAMRSGYSMANVNSVDITLYGRGGHGAYPHTTIDPIVIAAKLVLDLQTLVSREINPTDPAVVTVGSIRAGTKHNIIPDECHLQLTIRSYTDEVRKLIIEGIKRKALAAADSAGAKQPLVEVSEGTPALSNDPELTERVRAVLKTRLGKENVLPAQPVMGGEDFSRYGRAGVPSLMFALGVVEQRRLDRYQQLKADVPSLHSSRFYPDIEPSIQAGVTAMSSALLDLLDPSGGTSSE